MFRKFLVTSKSYLHNEKGFTLIEVLIVITIMGILASVAVPRFTSSIELANTAKIQADLQTLDAAIVMYEAEKGTEPNSIDSLALYVNDIPAPPKGKCRLKNETSAHEITATSYTITDVTISGTTQLRAALDNHIAGEFGK